MRLSNRNMLLVLLTVALATPIGSAPLALTPVAASGGTTTVIVDPALIEYRENATGQEFTVAIKIVNVTNLYGFDLKFRWNTTLLEYVSHFCNGILEKKLKDEVDPVAGTYTIVYYNLPPTLPFNGSGTVFTMTFRVKYHPVEPEPTAITKLELYETDLAAFGGDSILHDREHGTVILRQIPNPRIRPTLKVMPEKTEKLPTNSTFNINIWILGLNASYDIASFNITLNFNSTLIKAIRITEGSWPGRYANSTTQLTNRTDNASGTATYALKLLPPVNSSFTSGILFTVAFRVIYESMASQPPSCELTLAPTNLTDRMWGPILHMLENGTYTAYRPPPVAKFTRSPRFASLLLGQKITFNASESYHPRGWKIVQYMWDFGDNMKKNTTDPIITYAYTKTGNFTVVLNVTDVYGGFGNAKGAPLNIVELPQNIPYLAVGPPYVKFGPYPPRVVGQQFNISVYIKNLDATWNLTNAKFSLSYNITLIDIIGDSANVTILPHDWTGPCEVKVVRQPGVLGKVTITLARVRGSPPEGNVLAATIKFTVRHQGIYPGVDNSPITLSDINLTGSIDIPTETPVHGQIVIKGLSPPLRASFTYSPQNPKINQTVTFNASDSTPNDFNIANYTWNFGDGNITTVRVPIITHQFSVDRTYHVTLTVTDIDGMNNTTWKTITVEQATTDITPYIIAGIVAAVIVAAVTLYFVKIKKRKHARAFKKRGPHKSKSRRGRKRLTRKTHSIFLVLSLYLCQTINIVLSTWIA